MINLPKSTAVNRSVPKEKFYSKTGVNTKLRQLFTDEIEKITWANKIAPDTLNITAKDYAELQVFEIALKGTSLSPTVLKHIDTFIPYPILFILKQSGASKAVISFKEPTAKSVDKMKVDSYYETSWQKDLTLEIKGRSVDEIYKHFLFQIEPHLQHDKQANTRTTIEQNKERVVLQKQIEALNKQISTEPSIGKRQELARERHELEHKKNVTIEPKNISLTEAGDK